MPAPSVARLAFGGDTSNAASYTTASATVAGTPKAYLILIEISGTALTAAVPTGLGLTWTRLQTAGSGGNNIVEIYGAVGVATTGTVLITPSSAGTGWGYTILEISGADISSVARAFPDGANNLTASGASLSLPSLVTLAGNAWAAIGSHIANEGETPTDGGAVEQYDGPYNTPTRGVEVQTGTTAGTGVIGVTWVTAAVAARLAGVTIAADLGVLPSPQTPRVMAVPGFNRFGPPIVVRQAYDLDVAAAGATIVDAGSSSDRSTSRASANAVVTELGASSSRSAARQTANALSIVLGGSQSRGVDRATASAAVIVSAGSSNSRAGSRARADASTFVPAVTVTSGSSNSRASSRQTAAGSVFAIAGQSRARASDRATASSAVIVYAVPNLLTGTEQTMEPTSVAGSVWAANDAGTGSGVTVADETGAANVEGRQSLKVDMPIASGYAAAYTVRLIPARDNIRYRIDVDAKRGSGAGSFQLQLYGYDAGTQAFVATSFGTAGFTPTGSFARYSDVFTPAQGVNVGYIRVAIASQPIAIQSVYLDEVSIFGQNPNRASSRATAAATVIVDAGSSRSRASSRATADAVVSTPGALTAEQTGSSPLTLRQRIGLGPVLAVQSVASATPVAAIVSAGSSVSRASSRQTAAALVVTAAGLSRSRASSRQRAATLVVVGAGQSLSRVQDRANALGVLIVSSLTSRDRSHGREFAAATAGSFASLGRELAHAGAGGSIASRTTSGHTGSRATTGEGAASSSGSREVASRAVTPDLTSRKE